MKLLLDTHIYLWCVNDDPSLSKAARKKILEADEVYVSAASIWEAAIKINIKKLKADIQALIDAIPQSGFFELAINWKHAATVSHLPEYHRDPFDRMLIAQAVTEPLRFITSDPVLKKYSELVELV